MDKYNLNRLERHYMIEVTISYLMRYDREITDEEFDKEVEKMRKRRGGK